MNASTLCLALIALTIQLAPAGEIATIDNQVVFSAVINEEKIIVTMSSAVFDPAAYKTTDYKVDNSGHEPSYVLPTIEGIECIGWDSQLPNKENPRTHLSQLTVQFGEKTISAPRELIAHVIMPHADFSFDGHIMAGGVTLSADGKCVIVEVPAGDGGTASSQCFTFSAAGEVIVGKPEQPF
ncbi:hypothetical protein [Persicirhabdus sediminis]|uniref:Uncharacterized protein n=1 Tax=Persicirhabdus sediminis TaxID=454144 RepID=A0A8J7MF43_9BACT|nr:hypothetical protein [Persicirhabdus sediminis]MBK1791528.1 hypothetical protein [Persicirhabdus sediminis]